MTTWEVCPVCGGEPEVCEEFKSHIWVKCIECGQDMRPEYGQCIDCEIPLPPVIQGQVKRFLWITDI